MDNNNWVGERDRKSHFMLLFNTPVRKTGGGHLLIWFICKWWGLRRRGFSHPSPLLQSRTYRDVNRSLYLCSNIGCFRYWYTAELENQAIPPPPLSAYNYFELYCQRKPCVYILVQNYISSPLSKKCRFSTPIVPFLPQVFPIWIYFCPFLIVFPFLPFSFTFYISFSYFFSKMPWADIYPLRVGEGDISQWL